MRRPRHKLQVSTFPFLAVLLGAMGALILLLLVMDRRAKIVARNKALEAHTAARELAEAKHFELSTQAEQARRAEWEQKRQELHALLRAQEKDLERERADLALRWQNLEDDLRKENGSLKELEKRLLAERGRLDVKTQLLLQMRQGIARSQTLDAASRQEVEKLAAQLSQLERTLAEVKELKSQPSETYSLVPYRGKHGEGRRPVYVECTAAGLLFHPEGRRMNRPDFDVQLFRNEVERRGVELVRQQKDTRPNGPLPRTSTNPYVLFLVRPDGIESYYNATGALQGFDLDFGYELIDAAWSLDFSADHFVENRPPSQPAAQARPPSLTFGPPPGGSSNQNAGAPRLGPLSAGNASTPGIGLVPSAPTPPPTIGLGSPRPLVEGKPGFGSPGERPAGPLDVPWRGSTTPPPLHASEHPPTKTPGQRPGSPGNEREPTDPLARLTPNSPFEEAKPGPKKPAPPLGRMLANRDFLLTIECFADVVALYPSGQVFSVARGPDQKNIDQALLQAVLSLIERRQATVRAGEAAYRPQLRFQVHPEALRTYFYVYPLFENLRIPMTRENLEN